MFRQAAIGAYMTVGPRRIDPDKFLEANRDYIDRIVRDGVEVVYDGTLDTLFIEIGGPKEALSEHAVDNIMLRVDPVTLELVGCEILDFLADFVPSHRLIGEMIREVGLKEGQDSQYTLMEPQAKAVGELIMSGAVPELLRAR